MQQKTDMHIFQGMQQDIDPHKHKPEFLLDARNIRITNRGENTNLAITAEKSSVKRLTIIGQYVGHCVLNKYIVVFTTEGESQPIPGVEGQYTGEDAITRIEKISDTEFTQKVLYRGHLGFSKEHPIETLGLYENAYIQKVYWIDGINQPRVINITEAELTNPDSPSSVILSYNDDSFNFINKLQLSERVKVTKNADSAGLFPAGCVQYAISYYKKYGQETNLAWVSPLYYTSYADRAGSPEDTINNSFTIEVSNVDTNFDYLRLYSIVRTSEQGVPTVKVVFDTDITALEDSNQTVTILDTNTTGYTIDPSSLLYVGGEAITANSFIHKDGTMFFGNYKRLLDNIAEKPFGDVTVNCSNRTLYFNYFDKQSFYPNLNTLNLKEEDGSLASPKTFKKGEWYRLGIQFQHKTGRWSKVFYVGTEKSTSENKIIRDDSKAQVGLSLATFKATIALDSSKINTKDYVKARPVIVQPDEQYRTIVAQGFINPTVQWLPNLGATPEESEKVVAYSAEITRRNELVVKLERIKENCRLQYEKFEYKYENPISDKHLNFATKIKYQLKDALGNSDLTRYKGIKDNRSSLDNIDTFQGTTTVLNIFVDIINTILTGPDKNKDVLFSRRKEGFNNDDNDYRVWSNTKLKEEISKIKYSNALEKGIPFVQSSWFTRVVPKEDNKNTGIIWNNGGLLNDPNLNRGEIQNCIKEGEGTVTVVSIEKNNEDVFSVNRQFNTFHSPDIYIDDSLSLLDYSNLKVRQIGKIKVSANYSDSEILTSSPKISTGGEGAINNKQYTYEADTLAASLLYGDSFVGYASKDAGFEEYITYNNYGTDSQAANHYLGKFIVYPWHKSGSLNNDSIRGANEGNRSAVLKRKIIYNFKVSTEKDTFTEFTNFPNSSINIFSSDQVTLTKVGDNSYYGNIDTLLTSKKFYPSAIQVSDGTNKTEEGNYIIGGWIKGKATGWLYKHGSNLNLDSSVSFSIVDDKVKFTQKKGLFISKDPIRMRYKSTPHLIVNLNEVIKSDPETDYAYLHLCEIYKGNNQLYGGTDEFTLQSHKWIPAGEAVLIKDNKAEVEWKYGDTFYQRFDCLRTYSFTNEDENSIVDVVSFMVESRINLDGRYDKNRGNIANLHINPTNYNRFNPVYNQQDNFFSYRNLDEDYYKLKEYNTSITWTKEHKSAEEVDNWTQITLASTLDLDGRNGFVNALSKSNDYIYAFQDNGISRINFNARVQLNTSDGVPIEIANSGKVDGYTVLSDTVGCKNKWSLVNTASGLYFIDYTSKELYNLGSNGLLNVSMNHGMSNWFSKQPSQVWGINKGIRTFYDFNNNDLYINSNSEDSNTTLNFSDKLSQFVSFFDYYDAVALFNVENGFYGFTQGKSYGIPITTLHELFADSTSVCKLLGEPCGYSLSFISNQDSTYNKIFTNLEMRADWMNNKITDSLTGLDLVYDTENKKYDFFDTIRVSNEYQDTGYKSLEHLSNKPSSAKYKSRIWRINIPRDKDKKINRISNPWAKIQLIKNAQDIPNVKQHPFILHDLGVQYYV